MAVRLSLKQYRRVTEPFIPVVVDRVPFLTLDTHAKDAFTYEPPPPPPEGKPATP